MSPLGMAYFSTIPKIAYIYILNLVLKPFFFWQDIIGFNFLYFFIFYFIVSITFSYFSAIFSSSDFRLINLIIYSGIAILL